MDLKWFSMDLKWFKLRSGISEHKLFYNSLFRQQPLQSPGNHSDSLLKAIWKTSKVLSQLLTAKSMAELLGPCSGTAWAGRTGKHKSRCCWQRPAQMRKRCCHSCYTESVRESKSFVKFWQWRFTFFPRKFSIIRWNWSLICRELVAYQSCTNSFAQSFDYPCNWALCGRSRTFWPSDHYGVHSQRSRTHVNTF